MEKGLQEFVYAMRSQGRDKVGKQTRVKYVRHKLLILISRVDWNKGGQGRIVVDFR